MTTITQLSQLDLNATYSYADYLTWQLEETVELIRGKIMLMSPAPNVRHQVISRNLLLAIGNYFHKTPCKIFHAPFDVSLYDRRKSVLADHDCMDAGGIPSGAQGATQGAVAEEIYSVVQPDLSVICDSAKLTVQGCSGAPDWIIEILSPGNTKKEMRLKYELYQENGVTEYWLVYPYEQAVYQFVLDAETNRYQLAAMSAGDDIASPTLFPELHIDLADVFAE